MKNILMNIDIIKSILDGIEIKVKIAAKVYDVEPYFVMDNILEIITKYSKYKVNETIFVKETFNLGLSEWGIENPKEINYKAYGDSEYKWIPSTRMRIEYARIFLKITNVNIEMLKKNTYVFVYEFKRVNMDGSEL